MNNSPPQDFSLIQAALLQLVSGSPHTTGTFHDILEASYKGRDIGYPCLRLGADMVLIPDDYDNCDGRYTTRYSLIVFDRNDSSINCQRLTGQTVRAIAGARLSQDNMKAGPIRIMEIAPRETEEIEKIDLWIGEIKVEHHVQFRHP